MNRASLIIVGLLSIPLGCRALPDDLSDPRHAYYVASGQKADDRKAFQAAFIVCSQMAPVFMDALHQACIKQSPDPAHPRCPGPGEYEAGAWFYALDCANRLSMGNRRAAARDAEFFDENFL